MLTSDEALERILDLVRPVEGSAVPLQQARGRFLTKPVFASVPIPRFDQSAMDGYAVAEDGCGAGAQGRELSVVREVAAGQLCGEPVVPGSSVRVFTGAPVPPNTAAVVMQEDVDEKAEGSNRMVRLREPPERGEFIRRAGADLCEGQEIAAAGDRVSPQRIGLFASQGLTSVPVGPVPTISIVSTGDELVPIGQELHSDATIYNSNGPMLEALVAEAGALSVPATRAGDDLESLQQVIRQAVDACDILLVSGGVSVGDHDFTRPALEASGFSMDFWKVRMRPGKPLAVGSGNGRLAFGLPGNPVSAFVTFWLFVYPAIQRWMGAPIGQEGLPRLKVVAGETLANHGDRPHWLRGCYDGGRFLLSGGIQASHAIYGLSKANMLACLPANHTVSEGEQLVGCLLPTGR
jgi:molybdopterin molybdotransferase